MIDDLSFSTQAETPHPHKDAQFPEFSSTMAFYGENWDWKSHEVVTEDGYKLNMFRLIADGDG